MSSISFTVGAHYYDVDFHRNIDNSCTTTIIIDNGHVVYKGIISNSIRSNTGRSTLPPDTMFNILYKYAKGVLYNYAHIIFPNELVHDVITLTFMIDSSEYIIRLSPLAHTNIGSMTWMLNDYYCNIIYYKTLIITLVSGDFK